MKLTITKADNIVTIQHKDTRDFSYDLNDTVDLTEFIKHISESEDLIQCEPEQLDTFKESAEDASDEMLKLVEYVYKIVNAFNESYSTIYKEEETRE